MDWLMTSQPAALVAVAAVTLLAACDEEGSSEGQMICADNGDCETGEDPTGGPAEDGFGGCGEETTTVIADLSATPPGFEQSAAELLAAIETEYTGDFAWLPNDGPITVAHAGQTASFEMSVVHKGGEVRLVELELAGSFPNGQEGGVLCTNRLEIDAEVSLSTDDGVFAETWSVTLDHSPAWDGGSELPTTSLYRAIDFDAHQGTLVTSDFAFEGGDFTDAIVNARFEDGKVSGTLLMEVRGLGDMDWIGAGDVASFESAADE